ncbi:MAG: hypothetical protein HY923_01640 [Elusimicrobia bacterium]|nr:hypothetical protein [Elusimicrobiota bacterium]
MKAPRLSLAAILVASLVLPSAAEPDLAADVAVSSAAASKPGTVILKVEPIGGASPYHRRTSIGLSGFFSEGKPLEMTVWGSGGAVAGSLGGPIGAVIGAGIGALCGLVYSVFVVPHNGPKAKPKTVTIDNHYSRE